MTPLRRRPQTSKQSAFLTTALIVLLVFSSLYYMTEPQRSQDREFADAREISISEVSRGYKEKQFRSILVQDNKIFVESNSGTFLQSYKETRDSVATLGWNDPENMTTVSVKNTEAENLLYAILPDILFFLLIVGGLFWLFRSVARSQNSAMSFGKSKARIADERTVRTTFNDVAGANEAKEELVEVVDFLKNPKKYAAIGAKIPRGVLLVGAPGTGKTLLARAVAGEAKVPFFSISGSEFVEMFVGVGASRVRDLFQRAKRNAPCIIFIDEIDAVGRQRGGAGFGGGHDEREQTLNQILTEMDGFDQSINVIVMAATNRPDVLDAALLRPGRFDRRVFIDKPDLEARKLILEVHGRNKKLGPGITLDNVAKQTVGLTGADLENIMNEAAILAARARRKIILQEDLADAVEKVTIGPERRSRKLTDHEKKLTAYHELGHALVGYKCTESDPLHKISIVSRGAALGVTWFLPKEDTYTTTRAKFIDEICSLLGGRAAEEIVFGEMTTGASSDLERASKITRDMATRYGMGPVELGSVTYGENQGSAYIGVDQFLSRNYSEETAGVIDDFVRKTIGEQLKRAKKYIEEDRAKLEEIVEVLLVEETISIERFEELYTGKKPKRRRTRKVASLAEIEAEAAAESPSEAGEDGATSAGEESDGPA